MVTWRRMPLAEQARKNGENDEALGALPVWNLDDLYPGMDAPEVDADLARAAELSKAFEKRYKGQIVAIAGGGRGGDLLATAIAEYEAIEELLGRLGSFAGLVYSGNTADPARAKFYGDLQDRLTTI